MKFKTLFQIPAVQRMAAYIKANFDMSKFAIQRYDIIEFDPEFPLANLLGANRETFQRKVQFGRLLKIAKKVFLWGFDMSRVIVITDKNMIVDGQHRAIIAILFGLETIPVLIVKFKNKRTRSSYFADMSVPEGGQIIPIDRVHCQYDSGNPYARLAYKLANDPYSIFYGKVALRSRNGAEPKNVSNKMHITPFLKIINWIVLDYPRRWESSNEPMLIERTKKIPYKSALAALNEFGEWYFDIHGTNIRSGAFTDKPITGFVRFYAAMIKSANGDAKLFEKTKRQTVKKFQKFDLKELKTVDIAMIPFSLASYYNGSGSRARETFRVEGEYIT